jgi:hypothetical protein
MAFIRTFRAFPNAAAQGRYSSLLLLMIWW